MGISPLPPITDEQKAAAEKTTYQEASQYAPLRRFWHWTTHDPVAFYTSVIAVFTGILGGSTILLWWETRSAAERQTADTRILQRAYISVEPAGISASNDSKKSHPNIIVRNVGHLPAKNVGWVIKYEIDPDHSRSNFPVNRNDREGRVTLTPGIAMTQGGPIIYCGDGPHELRKAVGVYLYVWGIVLYEDGFGNERWANFCHRYNTVNLEDIKNRFLRGDGSTLFQTVVGKKIDTQFARIHRYGNDVD